MALATTSAAFRLPPTLVAAGFALRDEGEADIPFLIDLYATTRAEELRQVDFWTDEQKRLFLVQQFLAQRHHYRNAIDGCRFRVIECHGRPAGRLYLQDRMTRWHVVDIALLPEHRGAGVGGALLGAVIDAAAAAGKGVGLSVERCNPALRLYRRLGFVLVNEGEVQLEMERPPIDQTKQPISTRLGAIG